MLTSRQKDFLKHMDRIVTLEGYRQFEAFSAFLELGFRAMAGATLLGDAWRQNEDAYLAAVGRFQHPHETAEACSRALAQVVEGLEDDGGDFLGPIFSECAANPHAGQFFTPYPVALAMAQMSIGEDVAELAKDRIITISEPACGCGCMVLAAAEVLKERGIDPARHAHFTLVDIDIRCVQASYIQATLCGLSATVVHGDTIRLQQWAAWQTFTAIMFPKRIPRDHDHVVEPAAVAPAQHPDPAIAQQPRDSAPRAPLQLSFADI